MIPQDPADRAKAIAALKKRSPGFVECDGCQSFVVVSVAPGTLMCYCEPHGVRGMVAV